MELIESNDDGYVVVGNKDGDIFLLKTDDQGDSIWMNKFGGSFHESATSLRQTPDGGFIIAGGKAYHWNLELWLIKTDENGNTLWSKTFGGVGKTIGWCVQQTIDEGFIITGMTDSNGGGDQDVLLIKTDSIGNVQWTKTYGDSLDDRGYYVIQTTDSGYLIAGQKHGSDYAWLLKTDSNGDTLWTKTYDVLSGYGNLVSCALESNDGYLVTVSSYNFGFLLKVDFSGDLLWLKEIEEATSGIVRCNSVSMTDNGLYLIGTTISYRYLLSIYYHGGIAITDVNGNVIRKKRLCSSFYNFSEITSAIQTSDNYYLATGISDNNIFLAKVAPSVTDLRQSKKIISEDFSLFQNYPNPFNPTTTIEFELPRSSEITLKIYNIVGEEIATLLSASLPSGSHSVAWDASHMASGVYLYRFQAGNHVETRKMVLMK
jgi:hypothetical protein